MKNKVFTDILGVKISALSYHETLQKIEQWIKLNKRSYVCVAAVHLIMECQNNQRLLKGVNRAALVTPDGMPLVWLSRFYGRKNAERVYGPTLMQKLCQLAVTKRYKIFLLGGSTGQSGRLKKRLQNNYYGLRIVGAIDTPVRPISASQNYTIIKAIRSLSPDIVFVGLGCPWQEKWMIENRHKITVPVLIGVGAAFDFLSGDKKQADSWTKNAGLEWFFRFIQEPKRLWRRYIIMNAQFVLLVGKQLFYQLLFR